MGIGPNRYPLSGVIRLEFLSPHVPVVPERIMERIAALSRPPVVIV